MKRSAFLVTLDHGDDLPVADVSDYLSLAISRVCDPYDEAFAFPYTSDVNLLSVETQRPALMDLDFAEMELRVIAHALDRPPEEIRAEPKNPYDHGKRPPEDGPTLGELLEHAKANPPSEADLAAQRESWVRGEKAMGNDADEARERARVLAGVCASSIAMEKADDSQRREAHKYNVRRVIHRESGLAAYMRDVNSPWDEVEVQFDKCFTHGDAAPDACINGLCLTLGWHCIAESDFILETETL